MDDARSRTSGLLEGFDWFEQGLRRIAENGYAPDRDDGIVISMAPLHEVVLRKELEKI